MVRLKFSILALFVAIVAGGLANLSLGEEAKKPAETAMISVELRMVRMPRETSNDLFKPELTLGRVTVVKHEVLAKLRELEDKKKATVLCQPKLTTVSGNTAQVKAVEEMRFPTHYQPFPLNPSSTNVPPGAVIGPNVLVLPGGFETREVGTLLNATAVIEPDGKTINITLVPEISTAVRPGKPVEVPFPGGKVIVEQPRFRSTQITTTVQMESGTTILLGVSDAVEEEVGEEDKQQVTLMFLSAAVSGVE